MGNKKIMVIDGNSLMHRAFYAIPILTNKEGVFTNAVFGFTNMLNRLLEDYRPDYIAVAFDKKAPTFRHNEYEQYKANRQKTPEELSPQFDIVKQLLGFMNIPVYELDGYEADDILGFFSDLACNSGYSAYLVTGDKDALQLISSNTKVIITKKGISEIHLYDEKKLMDELGLQPAQIIDLKALMGDHSDNIPGIPGVGEKTALKLLHQYGTLENVLMHANKISGKKLKENLLNYQQQAMLSKRLATIVKSVPLESVTVQEKYRIPDSPELIRFLQYLQFDSIINKLNISNQESIPVQRKKRELDVVHVNTFNELKDMILDLEDTKRIAILFDKTLTIAKHTEKYYKVHLKTDECSHAELKIHDVWNALKFILEDESVEKITYQGKELFISVRSEGIILRGLSSDIFIAAYLLESTRNKYELVQLMYDYLNLDVDEACAADLIQLADVMERRLEQFEMISLYKDIEIPLVETLAEMELAGFKVDKTILEELGAKFLNEINQLMNDIYILAGEEFNINSPKQLGTILFDKLKLPVFKKTKTGYSTDAEVLERLKPYSKIVGRIIEYRQFTKLKSTYVDGLLNKIDPKDGRVRSQFNQTVTATGRISSTEPNLQNIPVKLEIGRQIRKVFVPRGPDYILIDADYSQIELRVLAHISEDPTFIDAFINNQDIHRRTASEIFNVPLDEVTVDQRNDAKAVNFGIIYGISDFGLAKNLGISRKRAEQYIQNYLNRYPKVKIYMENVIEEAKRKGYVSTLMNRRRSLPELKSRNFNTRSFGERVAMNMPIQGTAADIIKKAMNDVYYEIKKRRLKSQLILQVHDELIVDTYKPELEEVKYLIRDKMENALSLKVPLVVEIGVGESWYNAK